MVQAYIETFNRMININAYMIVLESTEHGISTAHKTCSEYDQEISQSQTVDKPVAS